MATPRSNWFKVADSVAFESWSNDVAATFMRLGAYMNTRWARDGKRSEDRGRVVLSSAVLQQLTGTRSLARARRVLHELAAHVTLVIDEQGADTACEWPKYAKFQEMGSRESPLPISEPSPSPSQNQAKKEEKRERAPSAPRARRSPPASFPGSMSDSDWSRLAFKHHVEGAALREVAAGWAGEKDRGYTADGWRNAIDRALRDRWDWTRSLFGPPGQGQQDNRESRAQAGERRTLEAVRRVAERIDHDPLQLAIASTLKESA